MSKITKSLISNKMPESSNIANYMVSISQNCPVCPEYKNTHNLDLLKNTKNPEISGFFRKRHLNWQGTPQNALKTDSLFSKNGHFAFLAFFAYLPTYIFSTFHFSPFWRFCRFSGKHKKPRFFDFFVIFKHFFTLFSLAVINMRNITKFSKSDRKRHRDSHFGQNSLFETFRLSPDLSRSSHALFKKQKKLHLFSKNVHFRKQVFLVKNHQPKQNTQISFE